MKVTILVVLGISLLVQFCDGEFAEDLTCKQAVSELTKRQLRRVGECTKKLNFKTGKEKNEKKSCVMKCVLQAEGPLDGNGELDIIGSMTFIEKNFPYITHERVRSVFMGCFGALGDIDIADATCKSYDPMVKCAMGALNIVCNPE